MISSARKKLPTAYVNVAVRKFIDFHPRTDEKLYREFRVISNWVPNLLTNAGRDKIHKMVYVDTSAIERGFGCISLTQTSITPAATDTTLSGEITTGGLGRAEATTKTHSTGTNTSLVEHTFTSDTTFNSTGVKASGLFNALSGGTMGHIVTFTNQPLVQFDQLRVSWLITAGGV